MEYDTLEKYWQVKMAATPMRTLHCMRRSIRSAEARLAMVPVARPKARYEAQGKKGKRPRRWMGTIYSCSSVGTPLQSRFAIRGDAAAIMNPAAKVKRTRVVAGKTAATASTASPTPMQFRTSTLIRSWNVLWGTLPNQLGKRK